MPYTSGTTLTFSSVLDDIKTFLTNSAMLWECVDDTKVGTAEYNASAYNAGTGTGARTVYIKAKGHDGLSNCMFAFYTLNSGTSYYTLAVKGIENYVEGKNLADSGYTSPAMYHPLNNAAQAYAMVGNSRCFYFMTISSTRYMMSGCGMLLQGGTPTEYPKPMFVGGCSTTSTTSAASISDTARSFFSPAGTAGGSTTSTLTVLTPTSQWVGFANHSTSGTDYAMGNSQYVTYPYHLTDFQGDLITGDCYGNTDRWICPVIVAHAEYNGAIRNDVYGEFDLLYYFNGDGVTEADPQDIITVDGVSYFVWRHPVHADSNSFCALKLEA